MQPWLDSLVRLGFALQIGKIPFQHRASLPDDFRTYLACLEYECFVNVGSSNFISRGGLEAAISADLCDAAADCLRSPSVVIDSLGMSFTSRVVRNAETLVRSVEAAAAASAGIADVVRVRGWGVMLYPDTTAQMRQALVGLDAAVVAFEPLFVSEQLAMQNAARSDLRVAAAAAAAVVRSRPQAQAQLGQSRHLSDVVISPAWSEMGESGDSVSEPWMLESAVADVSVALVPHPTRSAASAQLALPEIGSEMDTLLSACKPLALRCNLSAELLELAVVRAARDIVARQRAAHTHDGVGSEPLCVSAEMVVLAVTELTDALTVYAGDAWQHAPVHVRECTSVLRALTSYVLAASDFERHYHSTYVFASSPLSRCHSVCDSCSLLCCYCSVLTC